MAGWQNGGIYPQILNRGTADSIPPNPKRQNGGRETEKFIKENTESRKSERGEGGVNQCLSVKSM